MYIQLDGQLFGEGLYYINGFPINVEDLPLSQATINWLNSWLQKYWHAKYTGFRDYREELKKGSLIAIDKEGLKLKNAIQNEIQKQYPNIFVTYWSEARGEHLNDNGGIIYNWDEMVSL